MSRMADKQNRRIQRYSDEKEKKRSFPRSGRELAKKKLSAGQEPTMFLSDWRQTSLSW